MPKILYLVTEDWFFVSHFLPMAQAAQECGFEVVVATRVRADGARLAAEGVRVVPMTGERGTLNAWRAMRDFVQAFNVVRAERADIVHCIALRPVVIGGLAARLAGAREIILAPTGLGYLGSSAGLLPVWAANWRASWSVRGCAAADPLSVRKPRRPARVRP